MAGKLQRARAAATSARKLAKQERVQQAGGTILGGGLSPVLDSRMSDTMGVQPSTIAGVLALVLAAWGPKKLRATALGVGSGLLAVQTSEVTSQFVLPARTE